jgi:NAD(P)-dependent dehydrogenase (short-subunit alcohol dehydrogenase family)
MSETTSFPDREAGFSLKSFDPDGVAVVFGSSGGIGSTFLSVLTECAHFKTVIGFSRQSAIQIDLADEPSLERAAKFAAAAGDIRLVIDATGFLHDTDQGPEKSWRELNAQRLAHSFAINAIGPSLLIKHLLPRLPRLGKSVFASLSARVGSIGDNRLGGWYAYRASKAALNQIVRTASIELARRAPDAICVALHPGTVDTPLSAPFAKSGLNLHTPTLAAAHLLTVLNDLNKDDSGGFFDWRGAPVPW